MPDSMQPSGLFGPSLSTRRFGHLKWAVGLYALFLAVIVFAADSGRWAVLFATLHSVPFGDKVGHFAFMGTLAFLVQSAWPRAVVRIGPLALPRGTLVVMLIVFLEELSQRFFPRTRTFEWLDLTADGVGIVLGTLLARRLARAEPAASR